ncbi:M4 family metallopeptidase [Planococcus sp. N028]|uniref:Neutral metalloproteinase n=1 Tax=Planococcus shixiaomingii TaxID=3058393 RepID=A0ABT8N0C9_9BACL|nr:MULTISPECIES: M4 family metallopeptidase [unclassified Planococcus (in: firmicutes)]MDN7241010.1 M4 family metallopeptidase [Planococcus sp. N028]WKA53264.1 M4 family metallopeptidase [Planococcus sp. N022]
MKKHLLSSVSLSVVLVMSALSSSVSAASNNGDDEQVSINSASGSPNFIAGTLSAPSSKKPQEIVFSYLKEKENLYSIDGGTPKNFELISETVDELGITNLKLQQLYNGIPVFGAILAAHVSRDGVLTSISGELAKDFGNLDMVEQSDLLTAEEAKSIVLANIRAELHAAPEIVAEENPSLVIFIENGEAKLAYSSRTEFLVPEPGNYQFFIDAETGEILSSYNQIHSADPQGTDAVSSGKGVLGDKKKVRTVKNKEGSYLLDRTRGKGILTYDAATKLLIPGKLWLDADHKFNAAYDGAAVDAHAYAGQTFDYFKKVHGRSSYDGKGARIISTVHYGKDYNNAFWSGSQMVYGDGDGSVFIPLSGALDVVAHELTHAVTQTSAKLIYQGDSGAINESLSDIFGAIIEGHYSDGPDWQIAEDIFTPQKDGDALRSLADPTLNGLPDHYTKRYIGTEDFGGVHINSSISNKAAYLLANGGTHYSVNVNGIGSDKTGAIFFRTLTQYLTPNTTFRQFRVAAIQAATDLYGASSPEVSSVKAAFSAIGLN